MLSPQTSPRGPPKNLSTLFVPGRFPVALACFSVSTDVGLDAWHTWACNDSLGLSPISFCLSKMEAIELPPLVMVQPFPGTVITVRSDLEYEGDGEIHENLEQRTFQSSREVYVSTILRHWPNPLGQPPPSSQCLTHIVSLTSCSDRFNKFQLFTYYIKAWYRYLEYDWLKCLMCVYLKAYEV